MWFKNLTLYRLPQPWKMTADQLDTFLQRDPFTACSAGEPQSQGWASIRPESGLVHRIGGHWLLRQAAEKKLLPSSVVNQFVRLRAAEIEEQQGFAPGRKQKKELKEQITEDLLPRAFSIQRDTLVWIDPKNGWLAIDAANSSKADEVTRSLFKVVDQLQLAAFRTERSPSACMTDWLAADEAPPQFSIDQDTELRSTTQSKATVRFVRHALEPDDVARHIAGGKQCTRLAMTWNDKISFVLTESLVLKRITPLDVLKEGDADSAQNADERFDGDLMLMFGEVGQMLTALTEALGGEAAADKIG